MPRVVSFIVLVGILMFIGAMLFKVMAVFVLPLFLAAVLVVVFKPLHLWVRERVPSRPRLSALATTVLILLTVLLPVVWLGWNAYLEGRAVFNYLKDEDNRIALQARLSDTVSSAAETLPFLGVLVEPADPPAPPPPGVDAAPAEKSQPRLKTAVIYDYVAGEMGGVLRASVESLFRLGLGLVIMVLALYYFLLDGPSMINTMMRLSPLDNAYERELLDKFSNVSRAVVIAALASAVVQGLLAGIGYYFAFDPGAPIFLLTMITMVLAVVPFVGAAGVWIPSALWIFFYQGVEMADGQPVLVGGEPATGEPVAAIALAVYCAIVVSGIDNVIKPLVLHGQSNLHPLLALMSILGGMKALGPVGILVGPMLVAFIHALLVMVNKELRILGHVDAEAAFEKSMAPVHPAQQREAEAAASGATKGAVQQLIGKVSAAAAPEERPTKTRKGAKKPTAPKGRGRRKR